MAAEDYIDEYDFQDEMQDEPDPNFPYKECPKCGGKLVFRHNRKNGNQFMGCINFPSCRFTCQVDETYDGYYAKKIRDAENSVKSAQRYVEKAEIELKNAKDDYAKHLQELNELKTEYQVGRNTR